MSSAQTFEENSSVFDDLEGVTGPSEQCVYRGTDAVQTKTKTSPSCTLRIPGIIDNYFTTLCQLNAQTLFLTCFYILISHLIFLHVSVCEGPSSGNQTETMQHKTKLATFIYS